MSEQILSEHNYCQYVYLGLIKKYYCILFFPFKTGQTIFHLFFFLFSKLGYDDQLAENLRAKNKILYSENIRLKTVNKRLNSTYSRTLVENSKLRRRIQTEQKNQRGKRQSIIQLRKQVDNFKKKIKRKELKLSELSQNSLHNSGPLRSRRKKIFNSIYNY